MPIQFRILRLETSMNTPFVVVRDDAELVQDERVVRAARPRGLEVLAGERDVREAEVLHADEEEGEMGALKVAQRGRVGRDRLVVLALVCIRVRERDPRWPEA